MFSRRAKDHLDPIRERIRAQQVQAPPPPWQEVTARAVGGLQAGGFDHSGDYLLLVSNSGRGLLNCQSGELVTRDHSALTDAELDAAHLKCIGIGPLANVAVPIAGIYGGGLSSLSPSGWTLDLLPIDWPSVSVLLVDSGKSVYSESATFTKIGLESEIRFAGFSPSGRNLVLATSSDLTLWGTD